MTARPVARDRSGPAHTHACCGHRVVSVAMQSGTDAQVHAYMDAHGLGFPVVNDPDGTISQSLDVGVTPTIAIVSDGRMRLATSGWTSETGLRLRLWLARWG